jgi:hypothetical protein
VVDLQQQRRAPVVQRLGHVERPERVGAVEALLHLVRHERAQAPHVERPTANRERADVAGEVEGLVVDPGRRGEPERGGGEAPAQPRRGIEARLDVGAQRGHRRPRPAGRRVKHDQLAGVSRHRRGLQGEDGRVF